MNKQEKIDAVKSLTETLKDTTAIVLVDYAGLTVKLQQALKNKLSEVDSQMIVVKNSLFKIAGEANKTPKEALTDEVLAGPTAMIITKADPIAPLQVLATFMKESELPTFKVGVVENMFQDNDGLIALSKLPGKDVLSAQVVGAVAAPLYGIVGTLTAPMQKLVMILEAHKNNMAKA